MSFPDAHAFAFSLATTLMAAAKEWLRGHGVETVYFSSYTPNYFLPGLDADRFDRSFHAARHPSHRSLEKGRVMGILLQKADELAIFTDRAEAQGRDVDEQEILVLALVFGEKPLAFDADHLDRHAARSRYRIGVNISGR